MVLVDLKIKKDIYTKHFSDKVVLTYEDIIENYENSFEYEKIWMKAKDFKQYLINELSHG